MSEKMTPKEFQSLSKEPKIERENFLGRVSELFEVGLDSEDVYAYHGTTIEAIKYLIDHGRLPSSSTFQHEFYFSPINTENKEEDQLRTAEYYAKWNTRKFYVLKHLSFRPKDMDAFTFAMGSIDDEFGDKEKFLKEAAQHGVSGHDIDKLIQDMPDDHQGVILTLSKRIVKDYEIVNRTDEEIIVIPDGLPIKYITGIEPMGQYEWNILENIQQEVK